MNFKDFNKFKSFGHMSNKAKSIIFFGLALIILTTLYVAFQKETEKELGKDTVKSLADNTNISETEIRKIREREGGLWFKNYIWIDGKQYELFFDDNGNILVKKNGRLVPLSSLLGNRGAIINKDGKAYYYSNGNLIDLDKGDIVEDYDAQKLYEVKDNDQISEFNSNDLMFDSGELKYVDDDGNLQPIQNGDLITVDGKPRKFNDGIFRSLNDFVKSLGDGSYVAKMNSLGELDYSQKRNGKLIPIKKTEIPEGSTVFVEGTPMKMLDGELVDETESSLGVLSSSDLYKQGNCDYIVKMGKEGFPDYYKRSKKKLVKVPSSDVPEAAIVYYHDIPYQMNNGKLNPLKIEIGKPYLKACKVFALDADGKPMLMKAGEVVDFMGKKSLVTANNKVIPLTSEMESKLNKFPNRMMLVNGDKKLVSNGKISNLKNSNIVLRGGVPYKYVDGKLVRLSKEEIELLQEQGKKAVKENKTIHYTSESLPAQKPGIQTETAYEQPKDDFYISSGTLKASINLPSLRDKDKNKFDSEATSKRNAAIDKLLDSSSMAAPTAYQQQNNQTGKKDFIKENKAKGEFGHTVNITNPYTLTAGTVIDGTMKTGINSDLPGNISAVVNANVYDSLTHNNLLIPAGTMIFGAYSSDVSYGQKRVVMVWNKLILPNGQEVDLSGQQGYDLSGMSGLEGEVDNHYYELFKNVAMMSIFGAGVQYASGLTAGGGGFDGIQLIAASIGQQIGQTGIELIQKTMNIQPTIVIQPGQKFKILLDTRLEFQSAYSFHKPLKFVTNYRNYNL
ncbi:TraB/TrbI/VirB10 family type IV secretion system protein [Francisella philomiragia]|uniref:TrbI/VirB10 family protein n=1 Tax=Francisella philomiragia TaxID=28110 RepID=UPI001904A017|nr:TrbI/VirB10 family protein [Francisella philomiragia]MBK2270173.1 TrbI/VirB10 family protein [Francisella philomiragia]MBK2275837.1 TrbI/VirB10 family protein [Francisella philomiragia]MBK2305050.1 TrbI/VirB10 family protein [Francisella philomiragia]